MQSAGERHRQDRQIAALAALAPLWNVEERRVACAQAASIARVLDSVTLASASPARRTEEADDSSAVPSDTSAALEKLRAAGAAAERIARAQGDAELR